MKKGYLLYHSFASKLLPQSSPLRKGHCNPSCAIYTLGHLRTQKALLLPSLHQAAVAMCVCILLHFRAVFQTDLADGRRLSPIPKPNLLKTSF